MAEIGKGMAADDQDSFSMSFCASLWPTPSINRISQEVTEKTERMENLSLRSLRYLL